MILKKSMYMKETGIKMCHFNKLKADIKNIQNRFVIPYVDKASANFVIIWKQFYRNKLNEIYGNTDNYEKQEVKKKEINNRIGAFYKKISDFK